MNTSVSWEMNCVNTYTTVIQLSIDTFSVSNRNVNISDNVLIPALRENHYKNHYTKTSNASFIVVSLNRAADTYTEHECQPANL